MDTQQVCFSVFDASCVIPDAGKGFKAVVDFDRGYTVVKSPTRETTQQLQDFVVRACESHNALLTACQAVDKDIEQTGVASEESIVSLRAALTLAGAA